MDVRSPVIVVSSPEIVVRSVDSRLVRSLVIRVSGSPEPVRESIRSVVSVEGRPVRSVSMVVSAPSAPVRALTTAFAMSVAVGRLPNSLSRVVRSGRLVRSANKPLREVLMPLNRLVMSSNGRRSVARLSAAVM